MKTKILQLCVVFSLVLGSLLIAQPVTAEGEPPSWPIDSFWNDPADPSIYDWMTFGLYGYPPPEWICHWDFGDGTTSNDCFVDHSKQYNQDGDYTVSVQVTNESNMTSTTSRIVSVRTHDIAITKLIVPQSARVGQTRQIVVNIRNNRYPERVQVELYKNDFVWVGTLIQDVPVRTGNRTTTFTFNYTFTAEDARIGKVTFRALAFILNDTGGDDWPVDNDVISYPTRISR